MTPTFLWPPVSGGGGGTVVSVTASGVLLSSGGPNPNITFNSGAALAGTVLTANGSGGVTFTTPNAGTVTAVTASSPLFSSGGPTPNISAQVASISQPGFLAAADFATFNGKFSLPALTAGSILFSDGTTIAEDNAHFFWDNTTKRAYIGINPTASPGDNGQLNIENTGGGSDHSLNIIDRNSNNAIQVQAQSANIAELILANNTAPGGAAITLGRARGTITTKTQMLAGDVFGGLFFEGYTGSSFTGLGAYMVAIATENVTATASGAQLQFGVSANGTNGVATTALVLKNSGIIQMPKYGLGIAHFDASGNISSSAVNLAGADITGSLAIGNLSSGAATNGQVATANGSGGVTFVTPGGTGYLNGGNSFGANATLGLNDNFNLSLITNGIERFQVNSGNFAFLNEGLKFIDGSNQRIQGSNGNDRINFGTANYNDNAEVASLNTDSRTLKDTSGNAVVTWGTSGLSFSTTAAGLTFKAGSNARAGKATLATGTVTVANSSVTANSMIFATAIGGVVGGALVAGIAVSNIIAGTGFDIISSAATDARVVQWMIVESQ